MKRNWIVGKYFPMSKAMEQYINMYKFLFKLWEDLFELLFIYIIYLLKIKIKN
jgi:hypothetical protein